MLHPGEKAVEDALIALVELIDSLQAMEDAKWAEVSLEAISRSEEFEAAAAVASLLRSPGASLLRSNN